MYLASIVIVVIVLNLQSTIFSKLKIDYKLNLGSNLHLVWPPHPPGAKSRSKLANQKPRKSRMDDYIMKVNFLVMGMASPPVPKLQGCVSGFTHVEQVLFVSFDFNQL